MVYARNHEQNTPLSNRGLNGVSVTDLDRFLPTLAQQITHSAETTYCRISVLDQHPEALTIQAACSIRELDWDPAIGRRYSLAALPQHRMAVQTQQPILIQKHVSDSATPNMEWEGTLSPGVQSGALIPMVSTEEAWALISLGEMRSWHRSPISPRKVDLCQTLAYLATMALQKARLYEESNRQLKELAALYREKACLLEQARRASITDHLTSLRNRRYLDKALAREIALMERYGGGCSLIMLDIDDFKRCNDLHGHPAGDSVLRQLARILESHVRQADVVMRYGGEEFIVLLPQTDRKGALDTAERIRRAVRAHPFANGNEASAIPITVSLGIATYPQDASEAGELIARCDEALRAAKRAGKDRTCPCVESP